MHCAIREDTMPEKKRRYIYNCDGNNTFIYDDYPMLPEDVNKYVDEVADNSVTTFFMSCHTGMDMNYPGEAGRLVGLRPTEKEAETWSKPEETKRGSGDRAVVNMHALVNAGHDPLGLMLQRSIDRGMETFVTFRPNEVHCVDEPPSSLLSEFWLAHPEYHVGTPCEELPDLHKEILGPVSPVVRNWIPGGLDFAEKDVRDYTFAQIRELCERYPIDGIDIDFQRFPIYFRFGQEAEGVPVMNQWMREIRAMVDEVGKKRGRPLLLSVRIMAKPDQNLKLGLDPFTWAKEGLLDMVIVSHYLRNEYPLPISEYRELFPPELPLYASIEYESTRERYRELARELWAAGVDGVMLFNFFATRESGMEAPFELLNELGDPAKIKD